MKNNERPRIRFAAHVIVFNCDRTILKMLKNCGPFVEKIYVAYSPVAWTYNPEAREQIPNSTPLSILEKSGFSHKIEVIRGEWCTDEETRNACLLRAKEDGFDFLIIQDPDEFYFHADYARNIQEIIDHPHYEQYTTPWICFWKTLDYVLLGKDGSTITGFPQFAVNLKKDVHFVQSRITSAVSERLLPGVCFHLSYVLSDKELHSKISTWAHTRDFNTGEWFRTKWLEWNPLTRDLHPINPETWAIAASFNGSFPEELEGYESPQPTIAPYRVSDHIRAAVLAPVTHAGKKIQSFPKFFVDTIYYWKYGPWLMIFLANLTGLLCIHTLRHALYRQVFRISVPKDSIIYCGARFFHPWRIRIGSHSIIGDHAFLDGRYGLYIGNNVNIAGEVSIFTMDHDIDDPHFAGRDAPVIIRDWVYIGSRVTILPGVTINQGAVVASGSVVTRDVPAWTLVGGVPAAVIRKREENHYLLDTGNRAYFQ
jgi:acetyltransferase-like isoleucine patch superfamily enzyme